MEFHLILLGILLLLSAVFSATEVAFVSLSGPKVESMVKERIPHAKLIRRLMKQPRQLLITILIGNNVVNVASASLATIVLAEYFGANAVGVTTVLMTALILIFGEIVPKAYASSNSQQTATHVSRFIALLRILCYPVVRVLESFSNLLTGTHTENMVSAEELKALSLVGLNQGTIGKDEHQIITRLFSLKDITAEDIMTPRVYLIALDVEAPIETAVQMIEQHAFTRIPVMEESIDNIIGFIHAKDVLLAYKRKPNDKSLRDLLLPILEVPHDMPVQYLLIEFQTKNVHMTVVLDEFGGTEGIATLEDALEELVGEISDEHDVSKHLIRRTDKRTIVVSGDTTLRHINNFFNTTIPGGPLDTVAEVLLDELHTKPRKGKFVSFGDVTCTISETKHGIIYRVTIQK